MKKIKNLLCLTVLFMIIISLSGCMLFLKLSNNTTAETVEELKEALNRRNIKTIYLTGDRYEIDKLNIPDGKSLIGPESPLYPSNKTTRGEGYIRITSAANSSEFIKVNSVNNVRISGINFEFDETFESGEKVFSVISLQTAGNEATYTLNNIMIDNCTFRMNYTNAGTSCNGIFVNGNQNDFETPVVLKDNQFYGNDDILNAPTGIKIISETSNSIDKGSLSITISGNTFHGEEENRPLTYTRAIELIRKDLNLHITLQNNNFGTLTSPLRDELINSVQFLEENGTVRFESIDTPNQFVSFEQKHLFEFKKLGGCHVTYEDEDMSTGTLAASLTSIDNYINIVGNVSSWNKAMLEDIPKMVYVLPGYYPECVVDIMHDNCIIYGPLSPEYPEELGEGEAMLEAVTGYTTLGMGHHEEEEDYSHNNVHVSGLTFVLAQNPITIEGSSTGYFMFDGFYGRPEEKEQTQIKALFDTKEIVNGITPDKQQRLSRDATSNLLSNCSISNCVFDMRNAPSTGYGITAVACSFEGQLENVVISNNTFFLRDVEFPCNLDQIGIFGVWHMGSTDEEKKAQIRDNIFYGCDMDKAGPLGTPMTLFSPIYYELDEQERYLEISGNTFKGDTNFSTGWVLTFLENFHLTFADNTFGTKDNPYTNQNPLFDLMGVPELNTLYFDTDSEQNIVYLTTPESTVNIFGNDPMISFFPDPKIFYGEEELKDSYALNDCLFETVE